jgi:hypothetical protein
MTEELWEEAQKLTYTFSGSYPDNVVTRAENVIDCSGMFSQIAGLMYNLAEHGIPFEVLRFSLEDRILVSIVKENTARNISGLYLARQKLEQQLDGLSVLIKAIDDE